MNPPPPMFPASGSATASANPTATAASTAFPPCRRISTPAALASALLLAIIACGATVARRPAPRVQSGGNPGGPAARDIGAGPLPVAPPTVPAARSAADGPADGPADGAGCGRCG